MTSVSKTFQGLITFSRSTNGTYVNSAGYVVNTPLANAVAYSNQFENALWAKPNAFAQTNRLLQSQTFSNGSWTKQTGASVTGVKVVAPDGTLTGDQISWAATSTGQGILQATGAVVPTTSNNTKSIYVRADAAGGTVELVDPAATLGASVLTLSTSWQRLSLTETQPGGLAGLWLRKTASTPATVYIWGGQLVWGNVPGDYQATTTAALPVLYADYNGQLRARKLCEDATVSSRHAIYQTSVMTLHSTPFSASVYLKADSRTYALIGLGNGRYTSCIVNLSTGVVGAFTGSEVSNLSATTFNVGNGWWRVAITGTFSVSDPGYLWIGVSDGTEYYTGNGSSGIYVADSQLEPGTPAGPYYDTSTTQTYAPRLDYDPVTLAAKGLLIEELRTNLLYYSEQFDNTSFWGTINATVNPNTVLSPSGTVSADTLTSSGVAGIQRVTQSVTQTGVSTFSIYAKAGSAQFLQLLHASDGNCYANFNLASGVLGTFGTGSTSTITNAGSGWYRCTLSFNVPSSSNWQIYIAPSASAAYGQLFTATVASLFLWGAQTEAGAYATSYIPTVASQVTRAVDLVDLNRLSPWFNQREGTLYISGSYYSTVPATGSRGGFAGSGPYAAANSINVFNGGGATTVDAYFTSTTYPDATFNRPLNPAANAINKIGFGYNQNSGNYSLVVNAGTVSNVTSTQNAATFTALALGRRDATTGNLLNGHLQRFTFYPQRLTNAQLQSITA